MAGTGTINTSGLASDINLIFDSTHGLKQTVTFQQAGQRVTVNLDMATNPSANGDLGAGWLGSGSLTIQDGIKVQSNSGYVGNLPGSTGVATITGAGSTWTINSWGFDVGFLGSGTLSIIKGGNLNTNTNASVGYGPGSTGVVNIDGPGSTWTYGNGIYVGYFGSGTISITNGGSLVSQSPWNTCIGFMTGTGAAGVVNVDGTGFNWTSNDTLYVGGGPNGSGGGTLSITNGGRVSNTGGYIGYEPSSIGEAVVDGTGSAWTNSGILNVGYNGMGTLLITNGGSVSSIGGAVSGAASSVTVDGPGSTWTNNGSLYVSGTAATLSITNGGSVSSIGGTVSGTASLVTVDGPGSTWTDSGNLRVGGSGTLSITNGGGVTSTGGSVSDSVAVNGCNSTWTDNGSLTVSGTLSIANGGRVGSIGGTASGSASVITVDGAGSIWTDSSNLCVGYSGSGTLSIANGGSVNSTGGIIGNNSNVKGAVMVDGAGSSWTDSSSLTVGSSGTGTLSITGGGAVAAASVSANNKSLLAIDVGRDSLLTVGGGTGTLTNSGTVRILAGAGVPVDGVQYSPISAGSWGGTGTYQAIGGTWSTSNHTFITSSVTAGTSGSPVALNLASLQRALIDDNAPGGTGWELGASFLAGTSTTNITFTATATGGTTLDILKSAAGSDQSVLDAWTFSTTNYSLSANNPVYFSLKVGPNFSTDDLDLWGYNGTSWAAYVPTDLTYDGTYASFTATGLSGYAATAVPEPGTLALLAAGFLGIAAYARRKR